MFGNLKYLGIFCICTALLSGCGGGSSFSSMDGRIYYTIVERGASRIESMDPDGERIHYVVGAMTESSSADSYIYSEYETKASKNEKNAKSAKEPSLSADGKLLAYVSDLSEHIRVLDLSTGEEAMELSLGGSLRYPVFNRDSSCLLSYLCYINNVHQKIFVKTLNEDPKEILASRRLGKLSWSNFGNSVYVVYSNSKGEPNAYSLKTDGSEDMKLLIKGATEVCAAPVGGQVAAVIDGNIWIYDLVKKKNIKLVDKSGCSSPSWNPKGDTLAFVKDAKVFTVGIQGGEPKQITFTNALITDVCWAKKL